MKYLLILLVLLLPAAANAATLSVDASTQTLQVGDTSVLSISLQTEGDIINAIEGALNLPQQIRVVEVRYAGSVVPLWLERPLVREGNALSFGGVLPGGYQNGSEETTTAGNMFTVIVEAVAEGSVPLMFTPTTAVYLNDGEGTKATLSLTPVTLTIKGINGAPTPYQGDTVPPEPFTPEIASGELFGMTGRVLVFIAQDKDSGIARYELSRSFIPGVFISKKEAQSPEQVTIGDTFGFMRVRAIDVAGNTMDATIASGGLLSYIPLTIVVLILLVILLLIRRRRAIM